MEQKKDKFRFRTTNLFVIFLVLVIANAPAVLFTTDLIISKLTTSIIARGIIDITLGFLIVAIGIVLHIHPDFKLNDSNPRLMILMGGRKLIKLSYEAFIINSIGLIVFGEAGRKFFLIQSDLNVDISISVNYIFSVIVIVLFYINGYIRILVTSRRLSPMKRLFAALFIFMPIIQIGLSYYLAKMAATEYDHENYKINMDRIRIQSRLCKTKYPLLFLHGVGFRDFKYVNYWGRIPNELIKNGATVYYGHQEAWGTIEANAEKIREKILEILQNEGCAKVNIIAHSKGGLDARYVVSQLNMGEYVASLTTISTPHRGSVMLEFIHKLPNKLVSLIGKGINGYCRILGDKEPDFHMASKQFLIENSKVFNEKIIDDPSVYYQSYATTMKSPFSDLMLFVPYCIVRLTGGHNDGLVTVDSAKWGDYKGVITSAHHRGISHVDIIDLKREDYKGFDVREFFVQTVAEMEKKGF